MPGNVNLGGSVIKRESRDAKEVRRKLRQDGWEKTGEMGDRFTYFEKSGVNMTVIDGFMGTMIVPSGPVRGSLFGNRVSILGDTSTIGLGKKSSSSDNPKQSNSNGGYI